MSKAQLCLSREVFTGLSTTGSLYIDGQFECFTLEDVVRDSKIAGQTAIPYGTYKLELTYSPRFKREMPLLLDVPGFTGVRIHTGNGPQDTEGCILVGQGRSSDKLSGSRDAYNALVAKIRARLIIEPCFLEIKK